MFGENLTVAVFDERMVSLGAIYKVGEAVVKISQYREPCYKLGKTFKSGLFLRYPPATSIF